MAVQPFTLATEQIAGSFRGAWAAGANGDTGEPVLLRGQYALAGCVQLTGTVGTTTIQVSLDGTTWATLGDANIDFALTAAGVYEFSTSALWIRPSFGTSASGCIVQLLLRG